ncbi:MAG: HEAT repeat domain-containing protein, partial [Anaeromyxobacteraceae bacterium]
GSREKRSEAALRKQAQRVTQKYGPPENRQKAIAALADMDTPEALATLCLRFTVYSEPGITDDEEKATVRRHLVDAGTKAVEPVKEFLTRQEEGVAWGLQVLAQLVPPPEVLSTVLALLHRLAREYARDPGKKLTLLAWLAEHHAEAAPGGAPPVAEVEEALLPLLEDFSDDVRIAAVRVLPRAAPGERTREALIALLLRDQDNARVRGEVFQALADLGADVKGHRPSVEALLVEPYFLDREGRVKKRA